MKIIYAIPGLGTTAALFRNTAVRGYELRVLEWPLPKKELALKAYAAEFIKQIDISAPVNLIGVSFGGMLCSELADMIPTNKVVLISSCKTWLEMPAKLRLLRTIPVHRRLPESWLRAIAKQSRPVIGFEKALEPEFIGMINSMPANYFSYCINYILSWNKTESKPGLVSIHGTADLLLPHGPVKNAYTVPGGTHAMVYNKANEVNAILNKEFNEL